MIRPPTARPPDQKEPDMNDTLIRAQYSTGLSRRTIEQALIAVGKDIDPPPAGVSRANPQRLDIGDPQ
jgi:hypothetical protein